MDKMVIVINGSGGVGKDTLCEIAAKHYKVMNVSSIDPIKKIAYDNGWDGEKNVRSRKFLADLKNLFVEFNDLPLKYLLEKYQEFLHSDGEILFVHIREPEEIAKFRDRIPGACITLLIRGRQELRAKWENSSDDAVEQYTYDYYYTNDKPLDQAEEDFLRFFKGLLPQ